MRRCRECGASLADMPTYYRICRKCYRQEKEDETRALGREVERLRMRVFELEREGSVREVNGLRLDNKMLMRLIRLTHPDLHPQERQEEANELTAALLAFRRRNRR